MFIQYWIKSHHNCFLLILLLLTFCIDSLNGKLLASLASHRICEYYLLEFQAKDVINTTDACFESWTVFLIEEWLLVTLISSTNALSRKGCYFITLGDFWGTFFA